MRRSLAENGEGFPEHLRPGDRITCEGSVTHDKIVWHTITTKVIKPNLHKGDRVKWYGKNTGGQPAWLFGNVLSVEEDAENKITWVWVKADTTWSRLTMNAKDLIRDASQ